MLLGRMAAWGAEETIVSGRDSAAVGNELLNLALCYAHHHSNLCRRVSHAVIPSSLGLARAYFGSNLGIDLDEAEARSELLRWMKDPTPNA
jgi:hypothetical protein